MRALLFLSVWIFLLVGCGKSGNTTYSTPDGSVTQTQVGSDKVETKVTTSDGKIATVTSEGDRGSVENSDGTKMEMGNTNVDFGDLVYPGSKQDETGAIDMSGPEGKVRSATYTTADDFEKVLANYKGRLDKDQKESVMTTDGNQMAIMSHEMGKVGTSVTINREKDAKETRITILRMEK